ncbi:MAG TPA: 2Fe-2S iron-sulfur cluster-binding protein [Acidimicrobiales bacterium]|jgi:aerobic-type carbon monoxide dehydrogenase small subunit (CoxS/CutS family)|nr:2Fe-2S iron-sulfur cluster-binding protein [Acidimicrobiales bacterium]
MPARAPDADPATPPVTFRLDGREVTVPAGGSLLDALRDRLGVRSPKDGCSPQGQCGCCTVLVDGQPRVSCVTPVKRVASRSVQTVDGLDPTVRDGWAAALSATGGSQCGFCTPGIICRLEGLHAKGGALDERPALDRALAAHLCRCTGWQTIREAAALVGAAGGAAAVEADDGRDRDAAAARAAIEGRNPQAVGAAVALGRGGFADDLAPEGALVAVPDGAGGWAVGDTPAEARAAAGKVQGRRSTIEVGYPIDVPDGDWAFTLQTTWVEPAYLETDAAWCAPGGEPASPLGNGGAFGGKVHSPVSAAARELADRHGRPVRVLWSREDAVRGGPKRPPIGGGIGADGSGVVRVARTPGVAAAIAAVAPELRVEEVDVVGPPTSVDLRAAGWAEALVLRSAVTGAGPVRSPEGAEAIAEIAADGAVRVRVSCGDPLDAVVLRSYCIGATHMALGWVRSESLRVDETGEVHDLTIRSFGVLRAADTPVIDVEIEPSEDPPVNGSDAVFAAVAAAAWRATGYPPRWPVAP